MELFSADDDLFFEEQILRNRSKLIPWRCYLAARADMPKIKRRVIYERALRALPGSYKLWKAYLLERLHGVRSCPLSHYLYEQLNNTFERALATMHKMPRIWIMFLNSLTEQRLITRARQTFDRALQALPVTQHHRIWSLYLTFVSLPGIPMETSRCVFRRYALFDPAHAEDIVYVLLRSEAAEVTSLLMDDPGFQKMYIDEIGRKPAFLADYYVRRGLYEKARDVLEEGLANAVNARDFSVIFDFYVQLEQSALSSKMEMIKNGSDDLNGDESGADKKGIDILSKKFVGDYWLNDDDDVDLRLERLENLIDRRAELLNSVLLRQNPHDVEQWHRRVKLFEGDTSKQILTFTEAVRTVDPMKAVGKPHTLWLSFAQLYENHNDLVNARIIFDKAVQVNYKTVDNLASIWCEWSEMELRHKNFQASLELMRRSTAEPSFEMKRRVALNGNNTVQMGLHMSLRLWSFYVDLEESLGTLESTCTVYERILNLRIATPQIILNYAFFLEEHKCFEDAFKVYERGVKIFKYPHVKDIWVTYLSKFVKRYGMTRLERARELFEHAIEKAPAEDVKQLYLQYAKLEEDYGLAKRAMEVYDQAVQAVSDGDKLSMYEIYIARASEIFGALKTREIYEKAIESSLPDNVIKTMCMKYAELEMNLEEFDRARAIFMFAAQSADPHSDSYFWNKWRDFEAHHGSFETFIKMRCVKRTVMASFNQTQMNLSEYLLQKDLKLNLKETMDTKEASVPKHELASPERQLASSSVNLLAKDGSRMNIFLSAGVQSQPDTNNEDIELPEESDLEHENIGIAQEYGPTSFESLHKVSVDQMKDDDPDEGEGNAPLGAIERIKRQRRQ